MPWNPDYYKTGLTARAQRDAAQYNLKLKLKKAGGRKRQAASSKPQAASLKKDTIK